MAYEASATVKYRIQVSDLVDGRWRRVYRAGTAKVIGYGFQMQLGAEGYDLEVISDDAGAYSPGTTVRAFPHSVSAV